MKKENSYLAKVTSFRKKASASGLSEAHKLFILQVYSGLKRTASFDGFNRKQAAEIRQCLLLLRRLGLALKITENKAYIKILFASEQNDVSMLDTLQKRMFSKSRNKEDGCSLGALLSYPACCIEYFYARQLYASPFGFPIDGKKSASDCSIKVDARLNRFSPVCVIHHTPCSLECRKTMEWSDKVLSLYRSYDPFFTAKVENFLRKPVLLLTNNYFVRFFDDIRENSIIYSSIDPVISPEKENMKEDLKIIRILKIIKKGDRIKFGKGGFSVFSGRKLLLENTLQEQPYQLLSFEK